MKKYTFLLPLILSVFAAIPGITFASTLYSQSVTLTPGWNIVSTPRLLDSHTFSAAETSANFDIYVLDASQTSGWATMPQEGQTEFMPLFGYFIDNKTGSNQKLTFNYLASTTPNQQLFSRTFNTPGWYSIGIANPTYALPVGTAYSTDTDNPGKILNSLSGFMDSILDFTTSFFPSNPNAVGVGTQWQAVVPSDAGLLNDFRETKAYAVHILATSTYIGFQNSNVPAAPGSNISVQIQNATSVGAQNIATNVSNQPLGGFQTNLTGEGIVVQNLKIHFTSSSTSTLTGVSLVNENGATVAGPFDATQDSVSDNTKQTVTFTGSIDFPVGTHTYTIKGKVAAATTNGTTIQANTAPSTDWTNLVGDTTGNNATTTTGFFTMSTMTVKGPAISIANSANPVSQTIVAGGSNVLFANFQLDATQSGEDVRLSSLPVSFTGTGAASSTLSNCQVWNGSTALNTGSRVINSSNITSGSITFSFDNALTVPKGTIVTLGLTCNVSSSAVNGSTYNFALNGTAGNYTVTGVTSGLAVIPNIISGSSPTMTISSGATLAVSTDSSAPSYTVVAGGTTGVTANVIKFRSSNEAVNLSKVGLTLTNATASSSASDLTAVNLYAGNNIKDTTGNTITAGTLIGTAVFTGNSTFATSTLSTIVQLPKDTDATIVVKADLADVGSNQPGHEGNLEAIDYLNSQGTGVNSGSTVYGTAGITVGSGVAGLRAFNSFPTTIALDSTLGTTGVAGGTLMEFQVTADTHGSIGIDKFTFNISTSTATVTNVQLNAYTNSSYSTPLSGTYGASTGQVGSTLSTIPSGVNFSIPATSNAVQVSAGSTVYFKLTASVAGVTTGASVTTKLVGDSAYPSLPTAMGTVTSVGSSNFIWSPNATTTANITSDQDWTNGYGINGFPATGLIKTISQ